ncbi:MAG: hypothetical protein WCZ71_08740, partial [Proteiniphilum sp.]
MPRCKTVSLIACWLMLLSFSASPRSPVPDAGKGVMIETGGGMLRLTPLNERSIRVTFTKKERRLYPEELVYSEQVTPPPYRVSEDETSIRMELEQIIAIFNREKGTLSFTDRQGTLLLSEKAGGRIMEADSLDNIEVYKV